MKTIIITLLTILSLGVVGQSQKDKLSDVDVVNKVICKNLDSLVSILNDEGIRAVHIKKTHLDDKWLYYYNEVSRVYHLRTTKGKISTIFIRYYSSTPSDMKAYADILQPQDTDVFRYEKEFGHSFGHFKVRAKCHKLETKQ